MSRLALALLGEELAVPVAPRSSCGLLGVECADSIEDGGDGGGSDYSDTLIRAPRRGGGGGGVPVAKDARLSRPGLKGLS
jgi:hypothetical protein